jgi:hypothetical protein
VGGPRWLRRQRDVLGDDVHVSTDRLLIPIAGLSYLIGWGG